MRVTVWLDQEDLEHVLAVLDEAPGPILEADWFDALYEKFDHALGVLRDG